MLLASANYCCTYCIRFATEVVKAALADTLTQSSSILLSQYLGGTNAHFTYLMGLRNNSTHYLQLVDAFAPCLVGKYLWNNDTAMARMCSSLHQHEFDNLFSVSDEAFVLLLIDNYAARWVAEATLQKQLVSMCSWTCHYCAKPTLTLAVLRRGVTGRGNLERRTRGYIAGTLFNCVLLLSILY